jgi:hypothetical protein
MLSPQIKGHVPQLPKTESESTEPNTHLKGHVPQLPKTESKSTSSESKSQSVDSDGAEEVKQWLKRNKIKYDPDKFIKAGIDELESLELLEDKDTVKEVYPDMTTVDILKILKAIKKMTLTPKPQSRFRSSQVALSPVEA